MVTDDAQVSELVERLRAGDRRALARVLTRVENGGETARQYLQLLYPRTGNAHIVGVTGAPGVGKSTLVNALTREFRHRDRTVAIVAVDPTSPFSGGALLGDRIRMHDHSGDDGVFIRSMASRGDLGGLARATGDVVSVLDAAGFDYVFIETVGAGQVEVDIAKEAHTTIVIEVPGLGDDVQSIKAGLLEIADIFVVNKADDPDAGRVVTALRSMLHLSEETRERHPPIVTTIATQGDGITELAEAVVAHRDYLIETGQWEQRVHRRVADAFQRILGRELIRRLHADLPDGDFDAMIERIAAREIDPYSAANVLLANRDP